MSLLGRDTAFVSIGISCQPALQLYQNREHVSSLVGEPMVYKSSFFNWLMFSIDEVPRLLERMVAGPVTPQSIGLPPGEKVPVLRGHRAWLFHEGPNDKYTAATLAELALKYEHLRQNFLRLCSRPVRYFVLCNSQNNLAINHPHLSDEMSLVLDDHLIAATRSTIERLFPSGLNHLLVVGRQDLFAPSMREPIYIPPPDDTLWQGATAAWMDILTDFTGACRGNVRPARIERTRR